MIILLNSEKLDYSASFNQSESEVLDDLREKFVEKFGEEVYIKAAKIVVVEENFYNIIKDRYGPSLIGEHNDNLPNLLNQHLSI